MGVYPTAVTTGDETAVIVNGNYVADAFSGGFPGIVFTVLDPLTLKPWLNNASGPGLYGSAPVCGTTRLANFQFNNLTQSVRKQVMDFLDSIPNNYIVVARYISGPDHGQHFCGGMGRGHNRFWR